MHNVREFAARFSKCVWLFWDIMHLMVNIKAFGIPVGKCMFEVITETVEQDFFRVS